MRWTPAEGSSPPGRAACRRSGRAQNHNGAPSFNVKPPKGQTVVKPTGNPDFSSEAAMATLDGVIASIEQGYGLNRNEAINCLQCMTFALEAFKPGDPGLEAAFHARVLDGVDEFETWAEKVEKAIRSRSGES